jgi:hypothetical protein
MKFNFNFSFRLVLHLPVGSYQGDYGSGTGMKKSITNYEEGQVATCPYGSKKSLRLSGEFFFAPLIIYNLSFIIIYTVPLIIPPPKQSVSS